MQAGRVAGALLRGGRAPKFGAPPRLLVRPWAVGSYKSASTVSKGESKRPKKELLETSSTPPVAQPRRGVNFRNILSLDADEIRPFIHNDTFISPTASIIGYTVVNHFCVVMDNVVVRADLASIFLHMFALIEEDCVIAAGSLANPEANVTVGGFTVVGAGSVLRSCEIGQACIIGSGCVIEEDVKIGHSCVLAPRSVVPSGTVIPDGQIWGGNPAVYSGEIEPGHLSTRAEEMIAMMKRYSLELKFDYLPYSTAWLEKEKLVNKGVIER